MDGVDSATEDPIQDINAANSKEKEKREREAMREEEKERSDQEEHVCYALAALFTRVLDDVGIPSEADLTLVIKTALLNGLTTTTKMEAVAGKKEKENQSMLSALAPIVTGNGETCHRVRAGRKILLSRTLKRSSFKASSCTDRPRMLCRLKSQERLGWWLGTMRTLRIMVLLSQWGDIAGWGQGKWKPDKDCVYEVSSKERRGEMVKECDMSRYVFFCLRHFGLFVSLFIPSSFCFVPSLLPQLLRPNYYTPERIFLGCSNT